MSEENGVKTEAGTRDGAHRPHLVEYEIRSGSQSPVISDPSEDDDIQIVDEVIISRPVGVIRFAGSKSTNTTPKYQNEPVPNLVLASSGISDAAPRTLPNPTRNRELVELKAPNWKDETSCSSSSSRRRIRNLDGARMAGALEKYMNPENPFPSQPTSTSVQLTMQVAAEKDVTPLPRLQTGTREKSAEEHFETGTHKKHFSRQHSFEREGHQNHQQSFPSRQNSNGSISMSNSEPRGRKLGKGYESERRPASGSSRRNGEDLMWSHRNWNYRRSGTGNHHYPPNSRDSWPSTYSKMPNYRGPSAFHPYKNHNSLNPRWDRRSAPAPHRSLFSLKQNIVTSGPCSATASQNGARNPIIIEPQNTHPVDDNSPEGWLCPQCNIRYKCKSYRNRHKYTLKCKQIAGLLLKARTGSDSGN